jgi:hypothetical protein
MRIGVGLSIPELATRGGRAFSPLSLFTSGVQGAWYDPSDINSYMSGLGPELVTNGDFASGTTGWAAGTATLSSVSGELLVTNTGINYGYASQNITTVAGKVYRVTATARVGTVTTAYIQVGPVTSGSLLNLQTTSTNNVTLFGVFTATASTTNINTLNGNQNNGVAYFDNISVQEVTSIGNATLFQDSAGTTPVTAVEQPVGLMLDKSQGGLGPELVTNSGFSSSSNWTLSNTTITSGNLVFGVAFGYASQAISGSAGNYKLFVNKSVGFAGAGNLTFAFYNAGSMVGSAISIGSSTLTFGSGIVTASGSFDEIRMTCSTTDAYQVDSVSLARAPGNHASQATTASRPVLRARYNLLTYSEQFDNAAWSKRNVGTVTTVTANTTVAPDGTLTADTISDVSTSDYAQIDNGVVTAGIANTNYTWSLYILKDAVTSRFPEFLLFDNTNNLGVCIQLNTSTGAIANRAVIGSPTYTTTVQDAGLWWRLIHTLRTGGSATTLTAFIRPVFSATLGGAVDTSLTGSIVIWGADLRTGSSAGTYQRIAAATDYATAGFLPYLAGDGVDDQMSSSSINLTSTDKLTAVFGSLSNSTANQGVFQFGSGGAGTMNALYLVGAPSDMRSSVQGSTGTSQMRITGSGVSTASVYSQLYDIAGATAADESQIRVNGTLPTQTVQAAGPAGGGNFANTTLTIFQYAGAFFLSGRIYQLVFCGKTLSASELASTEAFVNSKTGAY